MKENGLIICPMGKEFSRMLMEIYLQECMTTEICKGKDILGIEMAISIGDNF
jgi:hypothetical protein